MQRSSRHSHAGRDQLIDDLRNTAETGNVRVEQDEIGASFACLLPLLKELDLRLSAAVQAVDQVFAARAAGDPYRGLAITPADVLSALGRTPGEPLFPLSQRHTTLSEVPDSLSIRRLLWLQHVYALTDLDLDIILIGLAPEIDLRYERLYAYLQDDVTRRRPSVDLALNLLTTAAGEKLQQRERFAPDSSLIRHRLVELLAEPQQMGAPLLARFYRLDDQIVRFLLLDDGMDVRLTAFCRMRDVNTVQAVAPLSEELQQMMCALVAHQPTSGLRLYFHGPMHCGQDEAVHLLASRLNARILDADPSRISTATRPSFPEIMQVLVREAWLRGALLRIRGLDVQGESSQEGAFDALWSALDTMPVDCVIESVAPWVPGPKKPLGVLTISFTYPEAAQRQAWWGHCLAQQQIELEESLVADLGLRYRMTYAQIRDAAAVGAIKAGMAGQLETGVAGRVGEHIARALFAAARAQSGHELAALATKIEPRANWEDLILPEDETAQLHEICASFNLRDQVFNDWGFAKKISYGRGITALFTGGSGTGKTMAAEVVANALGLDLYRIDLAQVVSKYIGETEKNLDRVFTSATNANAILFFDEADALFGKRSEVKDAHDRYANIETSYLLQSMEEYDGVAILASNLADHIDKAFTRRLAFMVHFPFPEVEFRRRLWQCAWPAATVTTDIDIDLLARQFRLSGGNIRNVGLAASYLAAAEDGVVRMSHVMHALRREHQKLGSATANDRRLATLEVAHGHGG